jgi:hypothetical protein
MKAPVTFEEWWQQCGRLNAHKRSQEQLARIAWKTGALFEPVNEELLAVCRLLIDTDAVGVSEKCDLAGALRTAIAHAEKRINDLQVLADFVAPAPVKAWKCPHCGKVNTHTIICPHREDRPWLKSSETISQNQANDNQANSSGRKK